VPALFILFLVIVLILVMNKASTLALTKRRLYRKKEDRLTMLKVIRQWVVNLVIIFCIYYAYYYCIRV